MKHGLNKKLWVISRCNFADLWDRSVYPQNATINPAPQLM